jgi:uncharacterized C2H2 Zn-finger protein
METGHKPSSTKKVKAPTEVNEEQLQEDMWVDDEGSSGLVVDPQDEVEEDSMDDPSSIQALDKDHNAEEVECNTKESESSSSALTSDAPPFQMTHDSWEAFDANLKAYCEATYQLYVIRTTTSVNRRNKKITDGLTGANAESSTMANTLEGFTNTPASSFIDETKLVPESYRYYSRTYVCTHGWKDRNRGTGKRVLAGLRSTQCNAKMCVTLQQRGEEWKIVVTRHIRSHNHRLSKELYLHYTENRRIYDPELLLDHNNTLRHSMAVQPLTVREQLVESEHIMSNGNRQQVANADEQARTSTSTTTTTVTLKLAKEHISWEAFHTALAEYGTKTNQQFRVRSSSSVQWKNNKIDTLNDSLGSCLIPEEFKWYAKLVVCSHGWRANRKDRQSANKRKRDELLDSSLGGQQYHKSLMDNSCGVTIVARVERNTHNVWRVMVNRQVMTHNHSLNTQQENPNEHHIITHVGNQPLSLDNGTQTAEKNQEPNILINASSGSAGTDSDCNSRAVIQTNGDSEKGDVLVVRAPIFKTIHKSWDAFHAALKYYADASYQSYRIRTTTAINARNQKLVELREHHKVSNSTSDSSLMLIPEDFQWYSKTLTCTHGWKDRQRSKGKRSVQVFRSTLCPVKMCATVQYVERHNDEGEEGGGWRVVVTRHVTDHNHNLSKELFQHYSENRRIYDPELLAIDKNHASVVIKSKEGIISDTLMQPTHSLGVCGQQNEKEAIELVETQESLVQATSAQPTEVLQPASIPLTEEQQEYVSDLKKALGCIPPLMLVEAVSKGTEDALEQVWKMAADVVKVAKSSNQNGEARFLPLYGHVSLALPFPPRILRSLLETSATTQNNTPISIIPPAIVTSVVNTSSTQMMDLLPRDTSGSLESRITKVQNDNGETMWQVPIMQRIHASWESFDEYLETYSKLTYQLYRVRTTTSVNMRNGRLTTQETTGGEVIKDLAHIGALAEAGRSRRNLIPQEHQWYAKTLVCTHGWKIRRRGKGKRVATSYRATNCPAKVCLTLQKAENNEWRVVVTRHTAEHNHEISKELYEQYSENRRIKDPEALKKAENLWREKNYTRRRLLEVLQESNPLFQMKDLHNLIQKWQHNTLGFIHASKNKTNNENQQENQVIQQEKEINIEIL